jgi:hypothetical protein
MEATYQIVRTPTLAIAYKRHHRRPNALYFTVGLHHEKDGLFGLFTPEPPRK